MSHATNAPHDTVMIRRIPTTAVPFASICRDAALTFVNESASWGKSDFCAWLFGKYQMATSSLRDGQGENDAFALLRLVGPRDVENVLAQARARVVRILELVSTTELGAYEFEAMAAGLAAPCYDQEGNCGYAPAPDALDIAEHVLSLFAADYLTRPRDYDGLVVCHACNAVEISENARKRGTCTAHATVVQLRRISTRRSRLAA